MSIRRTLAAFLCIATACVAGCGSGLHLATSANVSSGPSSLPPLPSWPGGVAAAGSATQVTVNLLSQPMTTAPSGATINLAANFNASSSLAQNASLSVFVVDANGKAVGQATNDLNNYLTILPTTTWSGPVSMITSMTVPQLPDGTYYLMLGLYNSNGPLQLTPGTDVAQDNQYRYYVGALTVNSAAPAPGYLAPATLDLTGYSLTFDDEFNTLDLSDSRVNDGSKWYTMNEQCCMQTSDGSGTAMAGLSDPHNPYSLLPGGGLDIRLQENQNNWTSGVMTSVDGYGKGFSQQYGYFEMKAKVPAGYDTWPAFWLLSTGSKTNETNPGEIDIMEYIANPGFPNYIATTLHDWTNGSTPSMSHYQVTLPSSGYHTYGMMWTATTTTFYFDGAVTFQTPTPAIMHQPYYLLVDLGIGAGWPTDKTPAVNDMQIAYVKAYAKQ